MGDLKFGTEQIYGNQKFTLYISYNFLSLLELQKFWNNYFKNFQRKQSVCAMVGGICTWVQVPLEVNILGSSDSGAADT